MEVPSPPPPSPEVTTNTCQSSTSASSSSFMSSFTSSQTFFLNYASNNSNLLWAEWISFSCSVAFFGILIIYYSNLVPEHVQRIFKYGKAVDKHMTSPSSSTPSITGLKHSVGKHVDLSYIEIPKRWFFHFYLFATIFYTFLSICVYQVYFQRSPTNSTTTTTIPNVAINSLLNWVVGVRRISCSIDPECIIICIVLLLIQVCRRLAECTLLSVYSDARMNIIHYIFGYSFYFGVGMSLLAEAPGFANHVNYHHHSDYNHDLAINHLTNGGNIIDIEWKRFLTATNLIGIVMFITGSVLQFHTHKILANLRKDKKGNIVTLKHSIPNGFLFDQISCPHYFAEILIYIAIGLILRFRSVTWTMVCVFVVTNQVIVGLFNHHWYTQSFPDYPKTRKAVIPFLI